MTDGPYDYAAERYYAERDAIRQGRGPESRPAHREDVPTRGELRGDS